MQFNKKAAGPNVDELNATHISESRVVYRRVCVLFVVYLFKAVQKNTHTLTFNRTRHRHSIIILLESL